nr:hypothetical protein [Oceanococcus sp. HetDA_MAG_MS8]
MSKFQLASLVLILVGLVVLAVGLYALFATGDWKSGLHQLGMAFIVFSFACAPQLLFWPISKFFIDESSMSTACTAFTWAGLACFGLGYLGA